MLLRALAFLGLGIIGGVPCAATDSRTYTYTVRGDVRLLFFWVGRDKTGGGRISISRHPEAGLSAWSEEVELVFGSNPERVPGKVNRWGYAHECAYWQLASDGKPELVRTVFTGFVRHSDDHTPSRLLSDDRKQVAARCFQYKAIRSEVTRESASAEIRVFDDANEFNYRNPDPLVRRYHSVIGVDEPESRTRLVNLPARYSRPFGMFSALSVAISDVLDRRNSGPPIIFAYNAMPYRLDVEGVEYLTAWSGRPEIGEVADIRFAIFNLEQDRRTRFSLAVPVRGELRGIPVRIEYQPHWWLRLRLDLER